MRDAAVAYANGKRAGAVWRPTYRLDVTGRLHSVENQIRIEVADLAINYMADFKNHPLIDYSALIARFGDRFQPQSMKKIQCVASALLGSVQLLAK